MARGPVHSDTIVPDGGIAGGTPLPPGRTPLAAWYGLGVLVLTSMFAFLDRQILNLVLPSLQKSLGLSDLRLGALQGLGIAIFAGVAGYPMGWLADRYGRRLLLLVGIAIWSLSTALCAFQTSFGGLFVCTIGVAVGEAGLIPIIFGILPDLFGPRERNTANYIFFAAGMLGGAAGVALGGAVLQWLTVHHDTLPAMVAALEPWRLTMIAVALPGPLFMLLVATLPGIGARTASPGTPVGNATERFLPFVLTHLKTLVCVFGAIFGYFLPMAALYAWLPLALSRTFGMAPAAAAAHMSGVMAIAAIAGLVLPTIVSRIWARRTPVAAPHIARLFAFCALPATLFMATATSPGLIFIAAAAQLGFCLATAACMPGIVQDFSPPGLRSRILSLVTIVGALAQAVSPLLIGGLSQALASPRGLLTAMTSVGGFGFALTVLLLTIGQTAFARSVAEIDR